MSDEMSWLKGGKYGSHKKVLKFLMEHPNELYNSKQIAEILYLTIKSAQHALWKISGHPHIFRERRSRVYVYAYIPPEPEG